MKARQLLWALFKHVVFHFRGGDDVTIAINLPDDFDYDDLKRMGVLAQDDGIEFTWESDGDKYCTLSADYKTPEPCADCGPEGCML